VTLATDTGTYLNSVSDIDTSETTEARGCRNRRCGEVEPSPEAVEAIGADGSPRRRWPRLYCALSS